jgi:hypothetical protein
MARKNDIKRNRRREELEGNLENQGSGENVNSSMALCSRLHA